MENRLEVLRGKVDELVNALPKNKRRYFFVHLYGVSHFCALLAIRRGLDPEIASVCGMLHDIYAVTAGSYDHHAVKGAQQARQILASMNLFAEEEVETIAVAISRHSDKEAVHQPYDEVLKDADVLHHCLYNPSFSIKEQEKARYNNLLNELGVM